MVDGVDPEIVGVAFGCVLVDTDTVGVERTFEAGKLDSFGFPRLNTIKSSA